MKDFILMIVIFAVFTLGYYVMKHVDEFMEKNQRLIAEENKKTNTDPVDKNPLL